MLPQTKLVPVFTADARAHRLSIQRVINDNNYIGSMGGIFPVMQVQKKNKVIQLCIAGTTYMGLLRSVNHGSVVNTDFFVDIYMDAKISDHFVLRLGTGHTSQHLSDDAIISGTYNFTNYARDYHQLFCIYKNTLCRYFIYGGMVFNYNFKTETDISNKALFQFGFEHSPLKFGAGNYFFYAADVKLRGELNYRSSQHYQLGYKYQQNSGKALRIAYNYSAGLEERGQFYKQSINFSSIGFYLDF